MSAEKEALEAYRFHVVPTETAGNLLFLFHGTGGDERQLLTLGARVMPEAERIAPRGDVDENGASRFFRRAAEGVYDMEDLTRATEKMLCFVKAHVERARPKAVFGLGYSNGANILATTIFAEPTLFDGAVLMHPLIPFKPEIRGEATTRLLVTAGENDPICPKTITDRLMSYLEAGGFYPQVEWHPGGHEIQPGEVEAARLFFASLERKNGLS